MYHCSCRLCRAVALFPTVHPFSSSFWRARTHASHTDNLHILSYVPKKERKKKRGPVLLLLNTLHSNTSRYVERNNIQHFHL
ncbi:hypothetical protein BCR43DRAFT_481796 [Syncephalastrum racemosum]|uniref:Uncharacterized protein n=1 Tax=Syncephalastrum racemosum TaxID=13706 RepID=A0A1X2HST0_SYNRA|nr:hypothetical protein BCR43DRAFT_481796 [Syncephalastrum racemosum]